MPDLLAQPELVTSRAPEPGVSPGEIAQPYSELANALGKAGEALTEVATTAAARAGMEAVSTDAQGNVQIAKAPIIGPASQAYERAVKMAALAKGEGRAKDADIALRDQYKDDPQGYLQAANAYKDGIMKQYADLGVPDVGMSLGRAIDATTSYNYRALFNEKRNLDLRSAEHDINNGLKDAQDTLVAGARAGQLKDPDPQNWPEPMKLALDKWRQLTNTKVTHPEFAYSQDAANTDYDQLTSELRANGIAHHFIDEMYRNSADPSGAATTTLNAARSILSDPTLNLKDAERHKIYNYVAGEIRSEDSLRKQDAFEARQARENVLDYLKLGGDPKDVQEQAGNVIDTLRRTGYPGEASAFLARVKVIQKGGGDYGRQSLDTQDGQRNAFGGGVAPGTAAEARLIQYESSGDPTNVNRFGFAGLYQFGAPLLKDLGVYTPGANEDTSPRAWNASAANAPGKWTGTFDIPGFPQVKSLSDFLQNPAAQKAVYDIHQRNMDAQISTLGLDKYEGQTVGGVPITRAGLYAMIHLAGPEGARVALQSGGRVQVADAFGSTPLHYAALAAQADMPTPAASLFLDVANASAGQRDLRAEWKTITDDFQKTHVPPSDKVINDIADRANGADDHALNSQIGHDVALMGIEARQPGMTLAQQAAQSTELLSRGAGGEVGAGYGAVYKDLTEITKSIREGMDKDPISTAVSYSRGRLAQPDPLDFSDPGKLTAGLQARVPIARWANQTWQGQPVAALDQADVDAIKGQLANPDPNVKAQIYGAIATLPEDLRGPTLKKIAGDDPLATAEAAAGGMLRSNPEVANSLFQGFAMLRGGKFDVDKAFGTKNPQGETFTDDFSKALPATVFPMGAARTDPAGDYATMGGMVRARYAYLSAQSGDMNYSADRVDKAVADVTGGVLSMNGGKFIAPRPGVSQPDFDRVLAGLTDNDLLGVTSLNGQPISARYLRGQARLENVGPGRYYVTLGRDQAAPIYAYQGANTERPNKFVLDLRTRQPAPFAYSVPVSAPEPAMTPAAPSMPAPPAAAGPSLLSRVSGVLHQETIPREPAEPGAFQPSGYSGIRG